MSLFTFDTTRAKITDSLTVAVEAANAINLSVYNDLSESDLSIDQPSSQFFISDKRWSLHQIIGFYLNHMKWADVWITTYGINEHSMRQIANHKTAGTIRNLYFLFSDHVKKIKPKEIQMAESIATAYCKYPSHSKIVVLKNDTHQVLIVSSMNLNRNNKLEAGAITTNPEAVNQFIQFLNSKLCIPRNS